MSRYEIRRDGQLVDTRDGLSYFTDDLTNGRAFAFTVIAVDFDGERSAPAAVSVVGGDRGGAVGSGGGRPTPPANLTSSVYSSSAAEVFWDRSGQRGLSYEVSVDGGQVVTTDGTSAFLSGLDGARGRGVDVVAIDRTGQRSGAANVTLGGGGGGNSSPPSGNGDAPAAPSNLRGELYSSSAGEVFWDRVSGTRLEYEVSLGGEVVTTTTGTSYFVGNRPGLDGTSAEVVAVAPDGARSSASSTTLGSGGSSNPTPDPDPGTDVPPAPANARIDVYSGTAAELFFDRAPSSTNVVETEIVRDGETLGTTNGTSFFDPDRTPGRSYIYELVAVNASGARSSASTVGDGSIPVSPEPGPPTAGGNVLSLDDADALLADVVALLDDNPAMRLAPLLRRLVDPDTDLPGRSVDVTGTETGSSPFRTRYACDAGGSYTLLEGNPVNGSPIYRIDETLEFDGCTIDDRTLDGTVVFRLPYFASDLFGFELRAVSLTDAAGGVVTDLNGRYTDETGRGPGYSARDSRITIDDLSYTRTDDGGRTRVSRLSTNSRVASVPSSRIFLNGGFDVTAPWSGEGLQASFRLSGPGEIAPRYAAGELVLTDRSGDTLLLAADTGDADTYSLVSDVDGSTASAIGDWTEATTPACTSLPDGPGVLERCTRRPVRYLVPRRQTASPF